MCNNVELLIWSTYVSQFYGSLNTVNKIKNAPLCVQAYVKSVMETMNVSTNIYLLGLFLEGSWNYELGRGKSAYNRGSWGYISSTIEGKTG